MGKLLFTWLAVLALLQPMAVRADINLETESLRLQFSERGDLLRVAACFPGCSVQGSKTRLLSAGQGM